MTERTRISLEEMAVILKEELEIVIPKIIEKTDKNPRSANFLDKPESKNFSKKTMAKYDSILGIRIIVSLDEYTEGKWSRHISISKYNGNLVNEILLSTIIRCFGASKDNKIEEMFINTVENKKVIHIMLPVRR